MVVVAVEVEVEVEVLDDEVDDDVEEDELEVDDDDDVDVVRKSWHNSEQSPHAQSQQPNWSVQFIDMITNWIVQNEDVSFSKL